jgi:plastocyanin
MRITILAVALWLVSGATTISAAEKPRPRTHTVVMEDMRFQPEVLAVASGDTIVWLNKDLVPHTATSKIGGFDSDLILASGSWTYTVRKKGAFAYLCTLHPAMRGTLRVK